MEAREKLASAIRKTLASIGISEVNFSLEAPQLSSHGDYATNVAMVAGKKLGKNPLRFAREFKEKINLLAPLSFVEEIKVVSPGFINFYLKPDFLLKANEEIISLEKRPISKIGKGKIVIIDYSSPNIAKPFGVGHLRSTIIGQALYNLYYFLGYQVIGDNHLGDWGTQFGVLLFQVKRQDLPQGCVKRRKEKGGEETLKNLTISDLEKLYVAFHQEAEKKPSLKKEARKWFKKLEAGDPEARVIWQAIVDVSTREFDRIYKMLGVSFDVSLGESFYQDKMKTVISDAQKKGLLRESQGAKVIFLPRQETPAMLVKSDGATTYLLRDLATIKYRQKRWQPYLIIYEVGVDQTFYFQQLFSVASLLGYCSVENVVHVSHGMILGIEGKFSTRRGKTIYLEEVLKEAIRKAEKLTQEAGIVKTLSPKDQKRAVQAIGIGAVKYNDLKQNPRRDVVFNWEKMLTLTGNSGPYLQYTAARCFSVLKRSGKKNFKKLPEISLNEEELAIIRFSCHWDEVIFEAAKKFSPNLVADFLYQLAQKYNYFYNQDRILGESEERENLRLGLTALTVKILEEGLGLLGIEVLRKM
ncbi:arginine--tRNA ligase [Candidatus Shapirobacteria bacterium]|nr:arginine--tRNA ligase [Candidatus Shapirobacteria bacterium]